MRGWTIFFWVMGATAAHAETFIPFRVECTIYAHVYPGVEDVDTAYKVVTLEGENDHKLGHQKVFEHGDYEFYVVTRETLQPLKKGKKLGTVEVYAYDAEIRNKKTGIVAQARSAGKGESHEGASYPASVALVTYPSETDNPLLPQGQLAMHCHHPRPKKKK